MFITKGIITIHSEVGTVTGPDPSDEDIELLRYVKLQEGGFGTVSDVNERTAVGRRQTQNRLEQLVSKGLLNVRLVGRTKVYWPTDEGDSILANTGN